MYTFSVLEVERLPLEDALLLQERVHLRGDADGATFQLETGAVTPTAAGVERTVDGRPRARPQHPGTKQERC